MIRDQICRANWDYEQDFISESEVKTTPRRTRRCKGSNDSIRGNGLKQKFNQLSLAASIGLMEYLGKADSSGPVSDR